jgi:hypothetical protein
MTGREFVGVWAFALGVTALIVGWVFLSVAVLPTVAGAVLAFVVPVGAMMAAMWLLLVRS